MHAARNQTLLFCIFHLFSIVLLAVGHLNMATVDEQDTVDIIDSKSLPPIVQKALQIWKESLREGAGNTAGIDVDKLDPLKWPSLSQVFDLDPKTAKELITLDSNRPTCFQRQLDPEVFHWAGTRFTFMNLHLHRGLWKTSQVG